MENSKTHRTSQNILVTGGGGFLGGAIVKRLLDRGDRVCSFSRQAYSELDAMGVQQIAGDLASEEDVNRALKNRDLVFHVAAKTGVWGPYDEYFRTNVTGTLNVIAACKRNEVPILVYTSSPSVVFDGKDMEGVDESVPYPDSFPAHYPKTKALAEQYVRKAAADTLRTISLRPHLIWGPGDSSLVPRILSRADRLKRVGKGKNLVDTVYIDNAADAHILAADQIKKNPHLSGNVYFISQDDPVPLWDMVNRILRAGGLPPVKKAVSPRAAWIIGALLEMFYSLFGISSEPPMTRFVAEELATAHWFDISAAKKDLGYVPKISTDEGLKKLKEWLEKENPSPDL